VLFFVIVDPTAGSIAFFVLGSLAGASIFAAWVIAVHALTFRLGNTIVVYKLLSVILHFAKKPAAIFSAAVRFVLYTLIPAAYVGTVQAEQLFNPDAATITAVLTLAVAAPFLAVAFFRSQMRRYESGNLIGARV
jgi:ABC-2 type transport system permease protein